MNITLIEPFYTGSHAAWADELIHCSRHKIELLALGGRHWKWRMHGGAVTLARRFLESTAKPDLMLATDMLDLTTFLALTRKATAEVPTAIYFHENQLTYPWSPQDRDPGEQRDAHYGFINFAGALAADALLFNSHYHRDAFNAALPGFLRAFPDHNELGTLPAIAEKSRVLPLGLDLKRLDQYRPGTEADKAGPPLILWNHRWEYDKNPAEFFQALSILQEEGMDFEVAILGESFKKTAPVFTEAKRRLGDKVVQFGFAENFADYAAWLWRADILPVHSIHDFFGASVVQAMYCNCRPLLPMRLAYPEHIPNAQHPDYFYTDFENLLRRLRSLLQNPGRATSHAPRSCVEHYDWQQLIPLYDEMFEQIALSGTETFSKNNR